MREDVDLLPTGPFHVHYSSHEEHLSARNTLPHVESLLPLTCLRFPANNQEVEEHAHVLICDASSRTYLRFREVFFADSCDGQGPSGRM